MSEKKKKERLTTPLGFAKWAWVTKPKVFMDDRGNPKGDPKFQIDVCFDPADPDWKKWAGDIRKAVDALPIQYEKKVGPDGVPTKVAMSKQYPFRREVDSAEQPTGRFVATFKTSEQYKPAVFDRYGQPLAPDVLIGNESKVRVNYTPNEYLAFGAGINLYLNAVQVVELVEYKSQTADAFGFTVEQAPVGATTAAAGGPPPAEDDLPF